MVESDNRTKEQIDKAQGYLTKILRDHATNPSTDGLRYGIWIEGGWKKLFRRSPVDVTLEDIEAVIAKLDRDNFWVKVW